MFTSECKFFKEITKNEVKLKKFIKLSIKTQQQNREVKVYYDNSSTSLIFENNSKYYQIYSTCKMIPLFLQDVNNSATIKQIKIFPCVQQQKQKTIIPSQLIIFQCCKTQQITQIYEKLKRLISHKGFNDFYKPLKRLGRGTFATVYLIEHKFTKQKKAAKVFSYQGQKLQFKGKQALQTQIKTLKQVDHINLIKFDGIYQTDNLLYLVTEYLSGGTLQQMMKNKSVHTGQFVGNIIKDILEGLNYLDSKCIMHRDLKPENIIYRKQDQKWVIGDFGLAAKSNQEYIYNKCGTMGYIAPQIMQMNEQNPKKYSQSCDIYSLGIIAYTLIIGSLPFHVESQNFFDKKIVWDLFDKPQCQQLNNDVIAFLKKLLAKQPKDRFKAKQALESSFFTDKTVVDGLYAYHERRRQQRYDKILKIANIQY